jgi:hypothetical protein
MLGVAFITMGGFHCTDLHETGKCSTALNEDFVHQISQISYRKYEKYG